MKLPALQFYPGDWRKDPGVQALSRHDRSVWFDMLLIMHESDERGVLLLAGVPMPEEAMAQILNLDNQTLNQTLSTLLTYGVASRRDSDGAIYSRRMVRDENLIQIRRNAGKMGGNPLLLNQNSNQNLTTGVKQNPTPSSSSSSSFCINKPLCTLAQAKSYAPSIRFSEAEAEHWWNTRNATDWTKSAAGGGHARKITSWQSDMATSVSWVKQATSESKAKTKPSAGSNFTSDQVGI